MLMKLSEALKKLDQFGVFFELSISQSQQAYKSVYGGLASLVIYLSTISYFIYLLIMWQNNQFSPSVVWQTEKQNSSRLNVTYHLFTLGLFIDEFDDSILSMVKEKNLFFVQGVFYGWNYSIAPLQINDRNYTCGRHLTKQEIYDPICQCFRDINQTFLYQDQTSTSDSFWEYQVVFCDKQQDLSCTTSSEQQDIIDHNAFWRLVTYTQEYNFQTGQINIIPQDHYFPINSFYDDQQYYFQIKVTKAVINVDEGLILQNWKTVEIVKSITPVISYLPKKPFYGPQVLLSMEKYAFIYTVRHIKISQLLAELCSVIQTLLILGFIVTILNKNLLMKKAIDLLMDQIFQEFSSYNIKKDRNNKILHIQKNDAFLSEIEQKEFTYVYEGLRELMRKKFFHSQLIYDIMRLQIYIQYLIPKKELIKLQNTQYGLKIDSYYDEYSNLRLGFNDFLLVNDVEKGLEACMKADTLNRQFYNFAHQSDQYRYILQMDEQTQTTNS